MFKVIHKEGKKSWRPNMAATTSHSLCLKMTLVRNESSLHNNVTTGVEAANANEINYPSKLLVVMKKDLTISDLCRQIEQNVQSMGYHYLHVQHISTQDMFRLSPTMILNDVVTNNTDLIATYSVHYSRPNVTNNDNASDINANDPLSLKLILQDWKQGMINSMAQCYQIMKDYHSSEIERAILNINLSKNKSDSAPTDVNINMQDLMLFTIFLCTCKMKNVQLNNKAIQIAYSILNVIINKHIWTSSDKPTVEFILHQLICSDYINDDQRLHLLNIGNDYIDSSDTNTMNGTVSIASMDSFKILSIDTDAVISKVRNINKIIKSVLQNALLSHNMNSNATNTLVSITNNPGIKDVLKFHDILKCCHHILSYYNRYTNKNKGLQQSEGYEKAINNLNYIAEALITKGVTQLENLLFGDEKHNEKEIHGFLDLMSDDKMPQHWRQFRVIITGIDIIWKHLQRIISPSIRNTLSNDSTIIVRLRIHLMNVMFILLEKWQINKESQMLFQHSHFNLLEEFISKWINDTEDAVEFTQILNNKNINNIISWPIKIQKEYFTKILYTEFLHQTYKTVNDALDIIKYIIKYPILLNDDGTDVQKKNKKQNINNTYKLNQIDFDFKKIYLQMIQTGLQKPGQKTKIIVEFSGILLNRLRFATYSNEQILLLRLLCLFYKNSKNNKLQKNKIIREVRDIYDDGKIGNLTAQSYVDLLLQSDSRSNTNMLPTKGNSSKTV